MNLTVAHVEHQIRIQKDGKYSRGAEDVLRGIIDEPGDCLLNRAAALRHLNLEKFFERGWSLVAAENDSEFHVDTESGKVLGGKPHRWRSGEALPFTGEAFKLAISWSQMAHLEDPLHAYQEYHRVIRSGGHLLFGAGYFTERSFGFWSLLNAVVDRDRRTPAGKWIRLPARQWLSEVQQDEILATAGFTLVRSERYRHYRWLNGLGEEDTQDDRQTLRIGVLEAVQGLGDTVLEAVDIFRCVDAPDRLFVARRARIDLWLRG